MQSILAENTHLTGEDFNQRITRLLQPRMEYLSSLRGYEKVKQTIADVAGFARRNDLDGIGIPYSWSADGILWCYTSLRLPANTERKLESMTISELVALVHTCNEYCSTPNDVLRYLTTYVFESEADLTTIS